MAVHVYQRVEIEGGARGRFLAAVREHWAPALARGGVRLAGAWATVGSTANWPEATLLWSMPDAPGWTAFLRDAPERSAEWARFSGRTESALLLPAFAPPQDPPRGSVYWIEHVEAQPGRLGDYHAALARDHAPLAASRGLALFGAWRHALRPDAGLQLWVLRDWEHWRELMESEAEHPGVRDWQRRCGEWLRDLDGHLLAAPPDVELRT